MSVFGITLEYRVGSETGPDVMQRLSVAFERAGEEMIDLGRHIFPLLPAVFEAAEVRQFDARGRGPGAGAWAPLSPAYAKWKNKHFPGMPILEATGALRDGLTNSSSPFASREWSASEFSFGTAGVSYASLHQTGAWIRWSNEEGSGEAWMPARPPFDFDATFEADLQKTVRKGLTAAIRGAHLDTMVGTIPE